VTDQLGRLTGNRKARYLEGRPVAVEGVVFDDFSREKHVIAPFPNGWPKDWPVWCGYDPGYAHPCGVLYWGVAPNGQHFIIDEIHGSGIDIDDIGKRMVTKERQYRIVRRLDDPRGANQKTQIAHGKTVRDYMRDTFQLHFRPWQPTQGPGKQSSVERFRVLLIEPKPLQVFENCVGFIGNMESWKNKTNTQGEILQGDDAYEDRDNDLIDPALGILDDGPAYTPDAFSFDSSSE
jgi:hypothetical protein